MNELSDLLERFRRGAELVAVVSTGSAGAEWDFKPAPEKWSLRQIVCHLADSEMDAAGRFRRVIAEPDAVLQWFDEKLWADNLDYHKRKFSVALETFRRIRGENYELLKDLPEDAWSRTGNHTRYGVLSLRDLLDRYAKHAENHARQIKETRDAWRASRK
jgi:hypothetical protein